MRTTSKYRKNLEETNSLMHFAMQQEGDMPFWCFTTAITPYFDETFDIVGKAKE